MLQNMAQISLSCILGSVKKIVLQIGPVKIIFIPMDCDVLVELSHIHLYITGVQPVGKIHQMGQHNIFPGDASFFP